MRRFGTIGMFGCDGGESAHSKWKDIARLYRCIMNPGARLQATKRLFESRQRTERSARQMKQIIGNIQQTEKVGPSVEIPAPWVDPWAEKCFVRTQFRSCFEQRALKHNNDLKSKRLIGG